MEIYDVKLAISVKKRIKKLPKYIIANFTFWVSVVQKLGLSNVQKIPGYHDEPLKGKRKGQRSIRLNRSYRAIYEIDKSGKIHFIEVVEVNKHEY